ncbi:MAG TPA: hypothetical protein VFQ85_15975 [Mycobacteriales bacterium]|jgi:hypothetical protein|nr:hypothetical protein [Mycobacteriales bacterium]
MRRTGAAATAALLLLATGCRPKPAIERVDDSAYPSTPVVTTSAGPVEPTASTPPPRALRSAAPHQGCVNGWREPAPGTDLREHPLNLLRGTQGFTGPFLVTDLRYFTGPDDANIAPESRQKKPVERWYGKVTFTGDKTFKVRFLAVRRTVGTAVVAVAPFATKDFRSPDWRGFDGEGGKSTFPGLPGQWSGMPYDYVKARELPDAVVGCLAE